MPGLEPVDQKKKRTNTGSPITMTRRTSVYTRGANGAEYPAAIIFWRRAASFVSTRLRPRRSMEFKSLSHALRPERAERGCSIAGRRGLKQAPARQLPGSDGVRNQVSRCGDHGEEKHQ